MSPEVEVLKSSIGQYKNIYQLPWHLIMTIHKINIWIAAKILTNCSKLWKQFYTNVHNKNYMIQL